MRRWIRSLALFTLGVAAGVLMMQTVHAQGDGSVKLSHVGINVNNFDEAVSYYKNTMGFREAFSFKTPEGKPILTYLQISRDTFLEIQPATPQVPAGFTHFGLETDDIASYVAQLRQKGVKVADPSATGRSGAALTNAIDPNGIRAELLQFGPNSAQRKAIDSWK